MIQKDGKSVRRYTVSGAPGGSGVKLLSKIGVAGIWRYEAALWNTDYAEMERNWNHVHLQKLVASHFRGSKVKSLAEIKGCIQTFINRRDY